MLIARSPAGLTATGAFFCAALGCLPAFSEPFQARNPNPFKFIHGQPVPVDANLPAAGAIEWGLGAGITNTLNFESSLSESLAFDYEAYSLDFRLGLGLAQDWAITFDVPLLYYGGGVLDNAIDNWHRALGLPRAGRDDVADDQFEISYSHNGVTETRLLTPTQGPGDIQLGLGHQLMHTDSDVLSTWLIAELPTGDLDRLTGNDEIDIALLLAWEHRLAAHWLSYNNLGLLLPGRDVLVTAPLEQHIGFGHSGLLWRPNHGYALKLQINAHSRYYQNTQLRMLGSAYSLMLGATLYPDRCSQIDIVMEEDIKTDASPDVSFLMIWKNRHC